MLNFVQQCMNGSNFESKSACTVTILQLFIVNNNMVYSWKFRPGRPAKWRADLQIFLTQGVSSMFRNRADEMQSNQKNKSIWRKSLQSRSFSLKHLSLCMILLWLRTVWLKSCLNSGKVCCNSACWKRCQATGQLLGFLPHGLWKHWAAHSKWPRWHLATTKQPRRPIKVHRQC